MARKATKKAASRSGSRSGGRSSARQGSKSSRSQGRSGARKGSARSSRQQEPKDLSDLFHETLKDIYMAEKQILRALPKMAKAVESEELRAAFQKHVGETEEQVRRAERIFEIIGKRAQTKPCPAIMGLVEEGQEIMKEFKGSEALDAGLIAGAQAVEHYEISRYGTLKAWAEQLGIDEAIGLIEETLQEEKNTDATLTQIAEEAVNREAERQAA
jgi:ferritin-like metal-binding protein YciE